MQSIYIYTEIFIHIYVNMYMCTTPILHSGVGQGRMKIMPPSHLHAIHILGAIERK